MSRGGGRADLAPELVAILARQVATWEVLHAYRTAGLDAALPDLGWRSSAGTGEDGVWRHWTGVGARRGTINYQEGCMGEPTRPVLVRMLVQWAAARLTEQDWAALDRLHAERCDAGRIHADQDLWFRRTYRPRELTDDERARIADAADRAFAVDRAARAVIAAALADDDPTAPGEQFSLFD